MPQTDPLQYAWAVPDTVYLYDVETGPLSIIWDGSGTLTSPVAKLYLNGTDVTSTYLTGGADAISGRIQSSASFAGTQLGGETFILQFRITESGNLRAVQQYVRVIKSGQPGWKQ
jgi:hypothetical protein